MPTIRPASLIQFTTQLLEAGGVAPQDAAPVAASLVGANLRGHDSHGVLRVPQYLASLKKGELLSPAEFTLLKESDVTVVADGGWGLGRPQCGKLLDLCLERVARSGVCIGTMRRSAHVGRLGEYCETAAEQGYVSMMVANTHGFARRVAPPGGKEPRLGTNPIAMGAPSTTGPLILDFGTSATAEGKVRLHANAGKPVPPGWLLDSDGKPTTDPKTLYADPPGTILPLGAEQGYKGFGLALMVEVLAGALSGGVVVREKPLTQNGNCVFLLLADPEHLGGASHFENEVTALVEFIRSCACIEGQTITLPGDPERRLLAQREAGGIPFDDGNWGKLVELATELGVSVPEVS